MSPMFSSANYGDDGIIISFKKNGKLSWLNNKCLFILCIGNKKMDRP